MGGLSLPPRYMLLYAFQDLKSKTEFREKVASIFSEVPKCLNVLLKTCTSPDVWNNVYRMSGLMVRDCASLIYLKVLIPYDSILVVSSRAVISQIHQS